MLDDNGVIHLLEDCLLGLKHILDVIISGKETQMRFVNGKIFAILRHSMLEPMVKSRKCSNNHTKFVSF